MAAKKKRASSRKKAVRRKAPNRDLSRARAAAKGRAWEKAGNLTNFPRVRTGRKPALGPGWFAKLVFIDPDRPRMREWMWVRITSARGDRFSGRLDNEPVRVRGIRYGQVVRFDRADVTDWLPPKGK